MNLMHTKEDEDEQTTSAGPDTHYPQLQSLKFTLFVTVLLAASLPLGCLTVRSTSSSGPVLVSFWPQLPRSGLVIGTSWSGHSPGWVI